MKALEYFALHALGGLGLWLSFCVAVKTNEYEVLLGFVGAFWCGACIFIARQRYAK
jgi:thiol-disulfide isomerase/thioredoxin